MQDTIFALSTARGKAGVAVVRVSGPMAHEAGHRLTRDRLPPERVASVRRLFDSGGMLLDEGLVIIFGDNASFTGEPIVEFQIHGSEAVVKALLRDLGTMPGLRQADPGEFSRRALENGTLDLTQVEALSDLIEAETEAQRRQALSLMSGALGQRISTLRADLVKAGALLEAAIDFADEEVPYDVSEDVLSLLDVVSEELGMEIAGYAAAERVRSGFEIALVGPVNVGKSTLLNYLAGRDAAITSAIPGTTRDVIEVRMDIRGQVVTILDTAGLRETHDEVEALGVEKARRRAENADLRVHLTGVDGETVLPVQDGDIVVASKVDLTATEHGVSGKTGQGVDALMEQVSKRLDDLVDGAGLAVRERHLVAFKGGLEHVAVAKTFVARNEYEIASEELRQASMSLGLLLGEIDVEDYLDHIFASFCIGK